MPISEHQKKVFLENLAKIVVDRRRELGISQEKLAEASGLTRNFISLIECGDTNPSILNLLSLADALEMDLTSIIESAKK